MDEESSNSRRYDRQIAFAGLGPDGQRSLRAGCALIVGAGGLGSWSAELLGRAGVGHLRLVDDDRADMTNLHRQAMYDQADADAAVTKVAAARRRLERINADVTVEAIATRLSAGNIAALADGADVILDGTDNFPTRFIINDYAVKMSIPWIFAGVVCAEAQTMTVVPPRTPCLRCVYDSPPPPCVDPSCRGAGVLGPAVAAIAAVQAAEAVKILSGAGETVSPYLLKLDLWDNTIQRIDAADSCAETECRCCKHKDFEFLDP